MATRRSARAGLAAAFGVLLATMPIGPAATAAPTPGRDGAARSFVA